MSEPESSDEEEDLEAAMARAIEESKPRPEEVKKEVEESPPKEATVSPKEDVFVPNEEGEQKSAEELLSEFEKMLG